MGIHIVDLSIFIAYLVFMLGYSRSLSNQGKVLINGARFDVVGTVNMSMLAVDVTSNESVKKGDEVVLIGKQNEQELSVSSFSDFSQLINYELLTRFPQDIPRIITKYLWQN
ncbi:hypothetical protein N8085_00480 [Salibacteraceae bacterium]|nr:hypothetical protein [Crocinitomicaceae bacterium]MDB0058490.1 hypothetical protein [Salibacteraceae bacterium]MDC1203857.1 hypothetical protein [Salibacteraceae bacterium]|tara:strand:+ start:266942 stop:267277 length:336 start_codon:yes stop_codon:yes gene_type:complete